MLDAMVPYTYAGPAMSRPPTRGCPPYTYNFRITDHATIDVDGYRPLFYGEAIRYAGKDGGTSVPFGGESPQRASLLIKSRNGK